MNIYEKNRAYADLASAADIDLQERDGKDFLTKLYNRQMFTMLGNQRIEHARRHGESLCLTAIDLDEFGNYNNLYGHAAGDAVLQEFATALVTNTRAEDMCFRTGEKGDEFIILATTLPLGAEESIQRVQAQVDDIPFSYGICHVNFKTTEAALEEMMLRADASQTDHKRHRKQR